MSDAAYHQSRAISGTDMRLASKDFDAWAFERELKLDGELLPWLQVDEPSKAMNFGTAVHMAILEPDRYEALKVVMPYVENFALKAGKAIKEEHEAKAQEKDGILLRCEEAWAIEKILINWRKVSDSVFPLGSTFQVEHRVFRDLEGVPCRGTLDGLCQGTVIDLKTTRDIHKAQDTIHWERYSVQVAHYAQLVGCFSLKIVFIENVMPYRVRVFPVDYDKARAMWDATILKIKDAGLA